MWTLFCLTEPRLCNGALLWATISSFIYFVFIGPYFMPVFMSQFILLILMNPISYIISYLISWLVANALFTEMYPVKECWHCLISPLLWWLDRKPTSKLAEKKHDLWLPKIWARLEWRNKSINLLTDFLLSKF